MKPLYLLLLLLSSTQLIAQVDTSALSSRFVASNRDYSTLPIRLPVSLAGGFAEIRPNHFHSGLDLRTGGKEGERIYAPTDGYVSRINISAWGGGKVLYITHPDGYRTVYMHLSAFCGEIGRFVRDYQYSHHTYAFDIELPKDSIRVSKGQLVALSGNTGGSAGPHLHYEIRLAANDQTINPLHFGIPYSDPIAPTIAGIKIYPADNRTTINGKTEEAKIYPRQNTKSKKTPSRATDTTIICGTFYTGIYTYDQMEQGSRNKNGVEKIELYVDGQPFHRYHVPTFMFEETRAINAIIDYQHYQRTREYYIVTRHLRGDRNNFSLALQSGSNGYLRFNDNATHRLEYRVSDHKGNTTRHTFFVRSVIPADTATPPEPSFMASDGEPITYFKALRLSRTGFSLTAKPYTVYDNDFLIYRCSKDPFGLSAQHRANPKRHPLPPHQSFDVSVTLTANLAEHLKDKVTVVCINGKNVSALPTRRDGDIYTAPSRSFGTFALRLDTIPPTVRPANFNDGQTIKGKDLKVKISDNLSGIVSYSCLVDGHWQLSEHDGKTSTLTIDTSLLHKGRNTVTFRLTDAVGNTTEKTFKVNR